VDHEDDKNWRGYAAWGSMLCGIIGLLFTMAVVVYIDFGQRHPYDAWEARYFLVAAPTSFLGVILGPIGKDTPRIPGLVLSACILLRVLGAAVSR
jgi:hypothetical protein